MADYTWPDTADWLPVRYALGVQPVTRRFAGALPGSSQVVDMAGEYWTAEVELPARRGLAIGAQRAAFFERLRGGARTVALWDWRLPAPLGTLRGSPVLAANAVQLASTISVQTTPGAVVGAGSLIGWGGQVSRVMAGAVADGAGLITLEVWPRCRLNVATGTAGATVIWQRPTIDMRLDDASVPIHWSPARMSAGFTVRFTEA